MIPKSPPPASAVIVIVKCNYWCWIDTDKGGNAIFSRAVAAGEGG